MQTRETKNITYHLTERHIYGSARLGMDRTVVEMAPTTIQAYPLEPTIPATEESERYLGRKYYELSNHLGNVLAVITDEKRMVLNGSNYSHYESVVVSVTDYSPFGVSLTGRTFTTTEGYRYGFNGQEKESEIIGQETHTSAEFWMYDARAGRRWQLDPKPSYSHSGYNTFYNSPILFCDPFGDTIRLYSYEGPKTSRHSPEFNANPEDIMQIIESTFNLKENQQNAFYFNDDRELQYDCSKMENYSQDQMRVADELMNAIDDNSLIILKTASGASKIPETGQKLDDSGGGTTISS